MSNRLLAFSDRPARPAPEATPPTAAPAFFPDIIARFDRQLRHVFVSATAEEAIGIPVAQLLGRTHRELGIPTEAAERWETVLRRVFDTGIPQSVEFAVPGPEGVRIHECRLVAEPDGRGGVASVISISRDVTRDRLALARADEMRAMLESTLDALSAHIAILDERGTVLAVNEAWRRFARERGGHPARVCEGADYLEACGRAEGVLRETAREMAEGLREVLEGRRPSLTLEYSWQDGGERSWYLLRATRYGGGDAPVRLVVAHEDVTVPYVAEQARRESEDQLRQAQKMEAVGRLAGGVAHDFNNLLTAIKGYTQILLAELDASAHARDDLLEVDRAADRAAALTRQLLAFSRRQILQPRTVSLNDTLAGLEKMLRRIIGEDVALLVAPDPALPCVEVDAGQIEQVIVNLVVNARDAMPRGGRLTLGTARVRADEAAAMQLPEAPLGWVRLWVSDTGTGIEPDAMPRIFDPFFTTKEQGKGTGLGLSTVYGIVRQSQGRVHVESAPGEGATFSVYLPAVCGAADAAPAVEQGGPDADGSEVVLLVEDEDAVRALTRRVLERCGYVVLEARNGVEAMHIAAAEPGPIDLMLTDVVMPVVSGYELARRMSQLHPETRVLYMSGYSDDTIATHDAPAGMRIVQKPFSVGELCRHVRDVLDLAA